MASGNLLMKMIEYSKIINKRRGEGHLKNDSQFSKLIYEYFRLSINCVRNLAWAPRL